VRSAEKIKSFKGYHPIMKVCLDGDRMIAGTQEGDIWFYDLRMLERGTFPCHAYR
jgi:hypothetical protein